jgi:hypothetical protein
MTLLSRLLWACPYLILIGTPACCQSAQIVGTITDSSGAPVPESQHLGGGHGHRCWTQDLVQQRRLLHDSSAASRHPSPHGDKGRVQARKPVRGKILSTSAQGNCSRQIWCKPHSQCACWTARLSIIYCPASPTSFHHPCRSSEDQRLPLARRAVRPELHSGSPRVPSSLSGSCKRIS